MPRATEAHTGHSPSHMSLPTLGRSLLALEDAAPAGGGGGDDREACAALTATAAAAAPVDAEERLIGNVVIRTVTGDHWLTGGA